MIPASRSVALDTKAWAESQDISVWFQTSINSTNSVAKETLIFSPFASIYLADFQTAGRGRNQNTWLQSSVGGQLFSSWVFSVKHAPQPILSPLVGLALYKALEKTWGPLFSLKAPNDIYIGDKKLAGILIENIQISMDSHRLIIGIGLNVYSKPDLITACCLADSVSTSEITSRWPSFLDELFLGLKDCAMLPETSLSSLQCRDILAALNRYTGLSEKFLEVLPDGSLKNQTRYINWSEL